MWSSLCEEIYPPSQTCNSFDFLSSQHTHNFWLTPLQIKIFIFTNFFMPQLFASHILDIYMKRDASSHNTFHTNTQNHHLKCANNPFQRQRIELHSLDLSQVSKYQSGYFLSLTLTMWPDSVLLLVVMFVPASVAKRITITLPFLYQLSRLWQKPCPALNFLFSQSPCLTEVSLI